MNPRSTAIYTLRNLILQHFQGIDGNQVEELFLWASSNDIEAKTLEQFYEDAIKFDFVAKEIPKLDRRAYIIWRILVQVSQNNKLAGGTND